MRAFIYKIENLINGKCYVGATRQKPSYRWSGHKSDARMGKGYAIHGAIRRYGVKNFKFEVILSVLELEHLNSMEEQFISNFNSVCPKGYNLTTGGDGLKGHTCPEHVREAISLRMMGNQYSLGHKHSEETKLAMSKVRKGKQHSLGRVLSQETKDKIGDSHKGNTYCLGREMSTETRRKIGSANTGKKILCITINKSFNSAAEATRYIQQQGSYPKADSSSILRCCQGKQLTAYKYTWRYVK